MLSNGSARNCGGRVALTPSTFKADTEGVLPDGRVAASGAALHSNAYYDRNADNYAARTQGAPPPPLLDEFMALVPAGGRVIDLGCGAGRELSRLVAADFQCVGFDLSPELAAIAHRRSGAETIVADMRDLDIAPACADGVVAIASLLHLPREDLTRQLKAIASWLKPGGIFLATMKLGSGVDADEEGRWFTLVEPGSWWSALAKAGFERVAESQSAAQVDVSSSSHNWMATLVRRVP